MINIIKEIRTELGMTQAVFAKEAGFNTVQQISGLENNQRGIGFNLLGKMVRNLSANGHPIALDVNLTVVDKTLIIH